VNHPYVRKWIRRYIEEDLGRGDITTEILNLNKSVKAVILAKENGVLAGLPFVREIFSILGNVSIRELKKEGETFSRGEILLELKGSAKSILTGERLSLNILQSLSGIATLTREFCNVLKGTRIKILDTRKTTPGYRYFEKYAVRVGGGLNHRYALYDMILIKDNHKKAAGGLEKILRNIEKGISPSYKVEVEVESLEELETVLKYDRVDMVLLDNFSPEEVKTAVEIIKGKVLVEVSGNINLNNLRDYTVEGVDFISSGSIIYGASWIDLSLKIL